MENTEAEDLEYNESVDDFESYEIDSIEFLKRNVEGYDFESFEFLERLQEDLEIMIERKLHHLWCAFKKVHEHFKKHYVESFEKFDVRGDTLVITTHEYNRACHCHPEYYRETFKLPMSVVNSKEENAVYNYLFEKETKELAAKAIQARQDADNKRQELEAAERAELARLRQKFPTEL